MKRCTKCVMPDTRPGISFDEEGVCQACRNHEKKKNTDWVTRERELMELCDRYRRTVGWDCVIAVSGGKDSHYQTHVMKEKLGMHPLLVTVEDNFPMTNAGLHNIKNISEEFGCEIISLKPNIKAQKHLMRKTFELFGKPTWYIDRLIYTYPLYMAKKLNIPLLVYGENVNYEYSGGEETYSAKEQIENGVASEIPKSVLVDNVVSERDLYLCEAPDISGLDPVYLSYFVPWNSYNNYTFAKTRGFWDLKGEWHRTHHIEDFDQIDSRAYLVHPWMKYPKFGHATATDYASRFIRYGMMDREEALKLVAKHDHNLDKQAIVDFCHFLGYTEKEFWAIVKKFYNPDIFNRDGSMKE